LTGPFLFDITLTSSTNNKRRESMTEKNFIDVLIGFKNDESPGWAGHMVLAEEINIAIQVFGEERTIEIMKQELGV
jgi:hypothetical protein